MKSKTKILIIGGYGNVGRHVVSILNETGQYIISVCGRSIDHAKNLSKQYSSGVIPYAFDVNIFYNHVDFINEHDIVLSCIDMKSVKFPKHVLEMGKVYIDLTADYSFILKIKELSKIAIENQGTAILCVGLAPGLSNLMVKHLRERVSNIKRAEIFVQLGLGDKNGKAAVQWILDNILVDYKVNIHGNTEHKTPFCKGKNELVFNKLGRFYPFNFADQHVIQETQKINETSTYLGFDSGWFTRYIALLKRLGLINALRLKLYYRTMVWLFMHIGIGKPVFKIMARVSNEKDEQVSISVRGEQEAFVTAQVATELIHFVSHQENKLRTGITFIENHLVFSELSNKLKINIIE